MERNKIMNIDYQYQTLLQTILEHGVEKDDRTGTGTKSIFGYTVRHNMQEGFPLLTTKKMAWKSVVVELLWFLNGRTDLRYLLENDCHIWTGDAYKVWDKDYDYEHPPFSGPYPPRLTHKEFEEKILNDDAFNEMYGDLGPIYGKQWRSWEGLNSNTDQIQNLINDLKTNPDSRRLMVSAWNVGELGQMTLPPCHYGFQMYTRPLTEDERTQYWCKLHDKDISYGRELTHSKLDALRAPKMGLSLMWNQRSVDTFLGLPFNIASYGLLLEILAREVNMMPDQLIGNLGDTHLYLNHLDQAKEQIGRELTWEEQVQWVMKNTNVEWENLYIVEEIAKETTPKHTRQPYPLPTLKHMKTDEFYKSLSEDQSLFAHLDSTDFQLENYQSHPPIKAPLSN
jgi:thymidylate synthase